MPSSRTHFVRQVVNKDSSSIMSYNTQPSISQGPCPMLQRFLEDIRHGHAVVEARILDLSKKFFLFGWKKDGFSYPEQLSHAYSCQIAE